jgi:ATP-binding cassette subfamily C protein
VTGDPGLSFKCASLHATWKLLGLSGAPPGASAPTSLSDSLSSEDAVEELALSAGMRSRRVLLDGTWWDQAALPMLARVSDRRRVARESDKGAAPGAAAGTGWVALLPQRTGGFRMLAPYPDEGTVVEWPVNEASAARLAPFAYTFHRRFAPRALGGRDILRFAFASGRGDLALLLMAGLVAALIGLLTPAATAG